MDRAPNVSHPGSAISPVATSSPAKQKRVRKLCKGTSLGGGMPPASSQTRKKTDQDYTGAVASHSPLTSAVSCRDSMGVERELPAAFRHADDGVQRKGRSQRKSKQAQTQCRSEIRSDANSLLPTSSQSVRATCPADTHTRVSKPGAAGLALQEAMSSATVLNGQRSRREQRRHRSRNKVNAVASPSLMESKECQSGSSSRNTGGINGVSSSLPMKCNSTRGKQISQHSWRKRQRCQALAAARPESSIQAPFIYSHTIKATEATSSDTTQLHGVVTGAIDSVVSDTAPLLPRDAAVESDGPGSIPLERDGILHTRNALPAGVTMKGSTPSAICDASTPSSALGQTGTALSMHFPSRPGVMMETSPVSERPRSTFASSTPEQQSLACGPHPAVVLPSGQALLSNDFCIDTVNREAVDGVSVTPSEAMHVLAASQSRRSPQISRTGDTCPGDDVSVVAERVGSAPTVKSDASLSRRGLRVEAAEFHPIQRGITSSRSVDTADSPSRAWQSPTLPTDGAEVEVVVPLGISQHQSRNGSPHEQYTVAGMRESGAAWAWRQRCSSQLPPADHLHTAVRADVTASNNMNQGNSRDIVDFSSDNSTPVTSVCHNSLNTVSRGVSSATMRSPLSLSVRHASYSPNVTVQMSTRGGKGNGTTAAATSAALHDSDNVRHNRVTVPDAMANDETLMFNLLIGPDGEDDEDEDVIPGNSELQPPVFCTAGDRYVESGGYWGLDGPRVQAQPFPRISSFAPTPELHSMHGLYSSTGTVLLSDPDKCTALSEAAFCTERANATTMCTYDDDDIWEGNSSAYEESLDDAQVEWLEAQLRASENPDGFFF